MRIKISSDLTFINKFIFPFIPLGLGIALGYFIDLKIFTQDSLPMTTFLSIGTLILLYHYWNIKKVEYNNEMIFVSNFVSEKTFLVKNATKIKRTYFDFYVITVKTDNGQKKIKFMPSFHKRLLRPFREPSEIGKLRELIRKEKAVANTLL
jgi:hypothetical protein